MNSRAHRALRVRFRAPVGLLCATLAAACSDSSGPRLQVTVSAVSPSDGPTVGGTAVTITGTNFPSRVDSVRVGVGRLASLVRVSATQLAGTTPAAGAAGAVDVTVYTSSAGNGTCAGCFSYNPAVTDIGVSPNYGPLAGGTAVTITGTNFPSTVDSVRVGVGRLASLVRVSENQLTGTTPAGSAAGAVDVTVYTTSAGNATCIGCFTYSSPVVFAHYTVTVLGAGFDSSRAVDMNDSGDVVGQVWTAASGWRGRLWLHAGTATDLDTLLPVAVNNHGSVVGALAGADTTPALWQNGALRTLGTGYGFATDINDAEQVAAWTGIYPGTVGYAYLWRNDSLTWLPVPQLMVGLLGVGRMNSRGQVAATCLMGLRTTEPQPCVLEPEAPQSAAIARGRESLTLGNGGSAVALNDSGQVIGIIDGVGYLFAQVRLAFIPTAINNSSQVVGQGGLWQDSATASLSSLVTDSTWRISNAVAINEHGQIAAYGVNTVTGEHGAVRLDPVAGASGASARRQRR